MLFCRDSEGGRGSVISRGSKHDSIRDSTLSSAVRSSEHDIRHISIELPQFLPSVATSSDQVSYCHEYFKPGCSKYFGINMHM